MLRYKEGQEARLQKELNEEIDPRLRALLRDLAGYAQRIFDKDIIITCLNRTEQENVSVGGIPKSAHLDNRAADLRVFNLTAQEQAEIVHYIKTVWGEKMVHVLLSNHGTAKHIHVNINFAERREGWKHLKS